MLIVDFIPLGSKYEFVRRIFPDISELQDRGYDFYCRSKAYIFESEATLEFVFNRSKELYRIGIKLTLDCSKADSLYTYLQPIIPVNSVNLKKAMKRTQVHQVIQSIMEVTGTLYL